MELPALAVQAEDSVVRFWAAQAALVAGAIRVFVVLLVVASAGRELHEVATVDLADSGAAYQGTEAVVV